MRNMNYYYFLTFSHFCQNPPLLWLFCFYELTNWFLMLPDKEGDWDIKTPQTSKRGQVIRGKLRRSHIFPKQLFNLRYIFTFKCFLASLLPCFFLHTTTLPLVFFYYRKYIQPKKKKEKQKKKTFNCHYYTLPLSLISIHILLLLLPILFSKLKFLSLTFF